MTEGGAKVRKCGKIRFLTNFRPKLTYRGRRRAEIAAFGTEIGRRYGTEGVPSAENARKVENPAKSLFYYYKNS